MERAAPRPGAGVCPGRRLLRQARLARRAGIDGVHLILSFDCDTDDDLRIAIEDALDADMVDADYGNVVDAVILWWRSEDGDLVDGLVEALTDLVGGGVIWLLTPKVGRPNAVDAADVTEAELKQHVLDRLEPYKCPREVVFVDSLPTTHLGKVDRGRLRGTGAK